MSESSSESNPVTNQQDNRRVIGERGISAEGGSSVMVYALDAEVANNAVNASTADLKAALNYTDSVTGRAFDFGTKAQSIALDSLNTQANLVKDAYADAKGRGALTDKILIGSVVMAGLVALAALRKAA
jgi:hypothetical protein